MDKTNFFTYSMVNTFLLAQPNACSQLYCSYGCSSLRPSVFDNSLSRRVACEAASKHHAVVLMRTRFLSFSKTQMAVTGSSR